MDLNTLAFKRRNILGELYQRSEKVDSIPVYINDTNEEPIGTVEESPNQYADAFLFHLPAAICKKLSTNSFDIGIDYNFTDKDKNSNKDRIKLNHIILFVKRNAEPIPRRNGSFAIQNK
jgi:hypothetical protein